MAKSLFASLIFTLIINWNATAQSFPIDDAGKITYYEVVEADSMNMELLYQNGVKWINTLNTYNHKTETTLSDSIHKKLNVENEFSIYSQPGVLKKLVGKFTYTTALEMKDNRYRYTFTDFVFHEYSPDRYHNIISTGKIRNLEELKALGSQKQWEKYRLIIADKISRDISALKIKMLEKPSPIKVVAPAKTTKWDE